VRTRFDLIRPARIWPVHAEVTLTANFFHGALPQIARRSTASTRSAGRVSWR